MVQEVETLGEPDAFIGCILHSGATLRTERQVLAGIAFRRWGKLRIHEPLNRFLSEMHRSSRTRDGMPDGRAPAGCRCSPRSASAPMRGHDSCNPRPAGGAAPALVATAGSLRFGPGQKDHRFPPA